MRLLPYRGQAFEGLEDVLARVVDDPVSALQSVALTTRVAGGTPYLSQPLIHSALFRLLDGNL